MHKNRDFDKALPTPQVNQTELPSQVRNREATTCYARIPFAFRTTAFLKLGHDSPKQKAKLEKSKGYDPIMSSKFGHPLTAFPTKPTESHLLIKREFHLVRNLT